MMSNDLTEQELALQLENMRTDAIIDLHEWNQNRGEGIILNQDGSLYAYKWFLGFNDKIKQFGMHTSLDKIKTGIDCNAVKDYLENDIGIFKIEYDTNFHSDGGCDIIVKFDDKNKYSNNIKLYKKLVEKMHSL